MSATHLPSTARSSVEHYLRLQASRALPVGPVDDAVFDEVLARYDSEVVFVHVGLSDVKSAFRTDPYAFLLERLRSHFSSVLVPGFTKSFRTTGTFHEHESVPEVGAFSRLFFEDADYRTPDPLHSILVAGDYRFDGCTFRDTFAPDGCFGQLDDDDVLYLNVGTPWLVSTQLHYVERLADVPYVERVTVPGTAYFEADGEVDLVQRTYDKNKWLYFWNRRGIRNDLLEDGRLDHHQLNGLNVYAVGARALRTFLEARLAADPYYLVR